MTTAIDAPGLAKLSSGDLAKELTNELRWVRKRLKLAEQKLAAWPLMEQDLKPYLQPGDYEFIKKRWERNVARWKQEEQELNHRAGRARHKKRLKEARLQGWVLACALRAAQPRR
jgi:hypothetical protein